MLAHAMNVGAVSNNEKANADRMSKQQQAYQELMQSFDAFRDKGETPTSVQSYELFCHFFRKYMQSYMDGGSANKSQLPDIRMYPLDSVLDSDDITHKTRDFVKGQNLLYGNIVCDTNSAWCPMLLSSYIQNIKASDEEKDYNTTTLEEETRQLVPDSMSYEQLVNLCAKRIMDS